jgi:hypothetical protein
VADELEPTPVDPAGAGDPAPVVVADPAPVAPAFDGWGDLADDDIVKRHGGDPVKMAQSFKELQREFHARNQPAAVEPEPEAPWEPLQGVQPPANVDPVFYGKVEQSYLMDPVGTFRELVAGGEEYAVYAGYVYDALKNQVGEFRAQSILAQIQSEQQQAAIEEMLAERVDARVTPITNDALVSKVDAGIDLAKAQIGEEAWAKFLPYLQSVIPAEGFPDHIKNSPTIVRDTLIELQQWQVFREQQAINAAAADPNPKPTPTRRGAEATLSGNTTSRPEETDYATRVKQSLKDTKIRVSD